MPRISEQARQARRTALLDAARAQFAANGFHATSMDDILRAAGMSAGGAYRYFSGKDAIIAAIAEEVVGGLTGLVRSVLDEDPELPLPEALARIVGYVDEIADDSGRLALIVWGEAQRDETVAALARKEGARVLDGVRELTVRAQQRGELPRDADPEALCQVLMSLVPGYLMQRRVLGSADRQRYAEGIAALLAGPAPRTEMPADRSGARARRRSGDGAEG